MKIVIQKHSLLPNLSFTIDFVKILDTINMKVGNDKLTMKNNDIIIEMEMQELTALLTTLSKLVPNIKIN